MAWQDPLNWFAARRATWNGRPAVMYQPNCRGALSARRGVKPLARRGGAGGPSEGVVHGPVAGGGCRLKLVSSESS